MTVHAAAMTRNVRFVQGFTILPWWHPLRLAEDVALTDILTRGRLEVGIGRGYAPHEFAAFNLDASQRRAMFDESVEILTRAWREPSFSYPQGRFWPIPTAVTVLPRPLQQPHPRIWTAVQSPDAMEFAVRHDMVPALAAWGMTGEAIAEMRASCDELLARYEKPFQALGSLEIVIVADTDAEAEAQLEHVFWLLRVAWHDRAGTHHIEAGRHLPGPFAPGKAPDPAFWLERAIIGSPETCVRKLRALGEQGVSYVVGLFDVGALEHARVLRSLELYGTRVIPALREQAGAAAR